MSKEYDEAMARGFKMLGDSLNELARMEQERAAEFEAMWDAKQEEERQYVGEIRKRPTITINRVPRTVQSLPNRQQVKRFIHVANASLGAAAEVNKQWDTEVDAARRVLTRLGRDQ